MKKSVLMLLVMLPALLFCSCHRRTSYADMKKAERSNIAQWITDNDIQVITEKEFANQDSTTDLTKNQYVYFEDTGVYMQILHKGSGIRLASGETRKILTKFMECDVETGDTLLTNRYSPSIVDAMMVTYKNGTYTAYYTEGYMYEYYESSAVPDGWLVPLSYIRLTRDLDDLAHVRLIVPHSEGTSSASESVLPCYYDITYQLGR